MIVEFDFFWKFICNILRQSPSDSIGFINFTSSYRIVKYRFSLLPVHDVNWMRNVTARTCEQWNEPLTRFQPRFWTWSDTIAAHCFSCLFCSLADFLPGDFWGDYVVVESSFFSQSGMGRDPSFFSSFASAVLWLK